MAFDINEARATIEEAKKRGLIRSATDPDPAAPQKPKPTEGTSGETLPDWLQKGIQ